MAAGFQISPEFVQKFGKTYPENVTLAKEGDTGNTMFIITQGKVKVFKGTGVGEKELALLGPGDFFGEMALLGVQDKRAASVKTQVETQVLELNRQAFEAVISRSTDLGLTVMKALAERVRDANGRLGALLFKEDSLRVAAYLAYLATEKSVPATPKGPGTSFVLKKEGVASALNVSPAAIDKFVQNARKARFLAQNGDWCWCPFPQYLLPFAEYLLRTP